jgi:hypothetical protein
VTQEEIKFTFADGWWVDEIEPVTLESGTGPKAVLARRAAVTRV